MFTTIRRCALILSVLMCGMGMAQAATGDTSDKGIEVASTQVRGHEVVVYQIHEMTAAATPGGMDAFAEDVATWLYGWTNTSGVEASSNLCRSADGSTWGATILTVYAHTSSPTTTACPAGMTATGVTIHSHPQRHRYKVNPIDRLFVLDGFRASSEIATWPDRYSQDDLASGPGYLVGQMGLHFQDGHGNIREVKSFH